MITIDREASTAVVKLPPGPLSPWPSKVCWHANRRIALQIVRRVYGSAFSLDLPIFGSMVVISDPSHIRQLFKTHPDLADTTEANLESWDRIRCSR